VAKFFQKLSRRLLRSESGAGPRRRKWENSTPTVSEEHTFGEAWWVNSMSRKDSVIADDNFRCVVLPVALTDALLYTSPE